MGGAADRQPQLLFIDDETDIRGVARLWFDDAGWQVIVAESTPEARALLSAEPVDAVLSDIALRGESGVELLVWARERRGGGFPFFLLSGCTDDPVTEAQGKGASGIFNKPCRWPEVIDELTRAVAPRQS